MISGQCAIFLSLHDRIDPETRKRDPHHAGIKKLPSAFLGTDLPSLRFSAGRSSQTNQPLHLLFHHFNPPILRPSKLGVVAAHRIARAKSLGRQSVCIHARGH